VDLPHLRLLWSTVATHLWQCSLTLGLIFVLAPLMRRAPARLVHLLWMAALCKILLPLPLFGGMSFGLMGRLLPWPWDGGASPGSGPATGLGALLAPPIFVVRAEGGAGGWNPAVTLTVLWLCGAGVIAGVWLRSALRARRAFVPAAALPEDLSAKLAQALAGSEIPPDRVVLTAGPISPCVAGVWRARIRLPRALVPRLDADELRAILLHEEAHRRRRDPLAGLLQRVAILGFFYYPLLWPVLRRLRSSTEMACDEHVLSRAVPQETYARALARTVSAGLDPAPALAAEGHSRSLLQRRFRRITEHGRCVAMPRHLLFLAAGCLAVVVASFFPASPLPAAGVAIGASDLPFVELERLGAKDLEVIVTFHDTSLEQILAGLSKVAGFELRYEGPAPSQTISVDLRRVPLQRALTELSQRYGLRLRVPNAETLIVAAPPAAWGAVAAGSSAKEMLVGFRAETDGVTVPELIAQAQVDPVYPEGARRSKIEGKVILQAVILADGSVDELTVLQSTAPGQGFEEAALAAVKQWRYRPATKDGQPVPVQFTVVIDFALE